MTDQTREAVTYMLRAPGCVTGPTESVFETALKKARESYPAGTEIVSLVPLAALSEAEERAELLQQAVHARCAERDTALARAERAEKAAAGIADDYMTSEKHHPGYVLIPTEKFEQLRALSPAPTVKGEGE